MNRLSLRILFSSLDSIERDCLKVEGARLRSTHKRIALNLQAASKPKSFLEAFPSEILGLVATNQKVQEA